MKNKTIINPETGVREDRTDYPVTAVREAIINALVHRDYSIHTEGMPIQIIMYDIWDYLLLLMLFRHMLCRWWKVERLK